MANEEIRHVFLFTEVYLVDMINAIPFILGLCIDIRKNISVCHMLKSIEECDLINHVISAIAELTLNSKSS